MDYSLQSTKQAIQCSQVCTASTLAIDATTNKQGRAHCVISLICLRVLYRYEKSVRGNQNPDLRAILILHVAILIRNLENSKVMTKTTNKYYLEELNLNAQLTQLLEQSLTPAFRRITRIQRVKAINFDYKNGEKKIRIKEIK